MSIIEGAVELTTDELLAQATCAVFIEGEIAGTAWLASDEGHLLTAGHLLCKEHELCDSNFYAKVEVKFSDDKRRTASRVAHRFVRKYGIDFAVLLLDEPVRNRQPLPISLVRSGLARSEFRLLHEGINPPAVSIYLYTILK